MKGDQDDVQMSVPTLDYNGCDMSGTIDSRNSAQLVSGYSTGTTRKLTETGCIHPVGLFRNHGEKRLAIMVLVVSEVSAVSAKFAHSW